MSETETIDQTSPNTTIPAILAAPEPFYTEFRDFPLEVELLNAITGMGWTTPTPIQLSSLRHSLVGKDLAGFAQTGTGKTGVFIITIAHKLLELQKKEANHDSIIGKGDKNTHAPFSVVIAPTRELALQISDEAEKLLAPLGFKSTAIFGGMDLPKQIDQLMKDRPQVVVATTGRLLDLIKRKNLSLEKCQLFVCDEVDRMFEMGFIDDTIFCLERLGTNCQKMLFSATSNPNVEELSFEYLENTEYVYLNTDELAPEKIQQQAIICDASNKLQVMIGLLNDLKPERAIIFTNTKITAEWLCFKLVNNGFKAELITGNLPQTQRIKLIQKIKLGQVQLLIATDVASRGLHISNVTHVFNFDVPEDPANYIHRIGRTARAGTNGKAITLLCDYYGENFVAITDMLGKNAPKADWYDEKYLQIVDNAPNPMKAKPVQSENYRNRETRRTQNTSDQRRRSNQQEQNTRSHKQDNRKPHKNNDHRPRESFSGKHHRDYQKPVHKTSHMTDRAKGQVAQQKTEAQKPLGTIALIKSIFGSIFGKKKT